MVFFGERIDRTGWLCSSRGTTSELHRCIALYLTGIVCLSAPWVDNSTRIRAYLVSIGTDDRVIIHTYSVVFVL